MLEHWIWMTSKQALSQKTQLEIVRHFGSMESAYLADREEYRLLADVTERELDALEDKDLSRASEILTNCANKEIHILTCQDAAFPERLRHIDLPPVVLYYTGVLPAVDSVPAIAVVGTRDASAYGLLCATRMGYQITRCGGLVVSGMAKGVDAMAAKGALTAGGTVVGVLGCGVDVVYPRANASLLRDVAANGCLISEYPPGTPPIASHFPVRNRLLSGLAVGVVVVEASMTSGALITARCALEQGRDVFAVPGNIGVKSSAGCNHLIKNGAALVESGWDVMQEYAALFPGRILPSQEAIGALPEEAPAPVPAEETGEKPAESGEKGDKLNVDKGRSRDYIDLHKIMENLTEDEKALVLALREKDLSADDLIDACQLPAHRVLAALTLLEVKGYVKRLPGKRFSLTIS